MIGWASEVQSVEQAGKTVTLLLAEGTLKTGDNVGGAWNSSTTTLTAE